MKLNFKQTPPLPQQDPTNQAGSQAEVLAELGQIKAESGRIFAWTKSAMSHLETIEKKENDLLALMNRVLQAPANPAAPMPAASYSQHGEDLVIRSIFTLLGIRNPSYIDVGAHHPYQISNTAMLYQSGSRGVNVEANPMLIDAFIQERPEDVNLNVGVGPQPGQLPFYVFGDASGRNTFSKEEADDFIAKEGTPVKKVLQLPVVTLTQIIDRYCDGLFPDFMDIDVEGLDYDVLESCDFSLGKPLVICAEVRKGKRSKTNLMMDKKGYEPYCRMIGDTIYTRKGIKEQLLGLSG